LTTLVAERRRELAIRAAVGASPGELVRTIAVHGFVLVTVGLLLGLGAAALASRTLSSLLHGVVPLDAVSFIGTALVVGSAAMTFTWLAARRVRHVDPMMVLRQE
jgi:ABC-type antimicrobial peptide transport system permease subunit